MKYAILACCMFLINVSACKEDPEFNMLKRKWKVLKVTPSSEGGGYWNMDSDIFDLTQLAESAQDAETKRWIETKGGKHIIRLKDSQFYWQVSELTEDRLKIGLRRLDPSDQVDKLMFTLDCELTMN